MDKTEKIRVALFASGSGTNVQQIAEYFKGHHSVEVALVVVNNPHAYVIERAQQLHIPVYYHGREGFSETSAVLSLLQKERVNWIVLAGFLWLIPREIIAHFPNKIINIHPALLPKYGGKGMYGQRVHQAVFDAGEKETGITIHYVNEAYDEGDIIFQAKCSLDATDSPVEIAQKIHLLEKKHFPPVLEDVFLGR